MSINTNRRRYLQGLGTAGLLGLAGCMGGSDDGNGGGDRTTWSLASNPSDSPPFTWGAIIQSLMDQESDQLGLQPVSTTGFLDNYTRVSEGTDDSGLSSAASYYSAKEGTTPFEEPMDRLAVGISPVIHKSGIYLATYPDSDIETLDDFAGKTFSFLHRGSATNPINQALFEEAGVFDEMETVYQGFSDTRSAVVEDRIDAWQHLFFDGYYHNGAEIEQAESIGGVKHIPIPDDVREAVMERFDAGWTYNQVDPSGSDIDIQAESHIDYFYTPSQVYVEPDKSEDLVYHLTQIMVENQDWLSDQNSVFETFGWGDSPAPVERFGLEGLAKEMFHPGALQYYEDAGYDVPE